MFGEFVSLHKVFYVIFSVSVFFIVHDFQYKLYFCLIYHVYVETVKNGTSLYYGCDLRYDRIC